MALCRTNPVLLPTKDGLRIACRVMGAHHKRTAILTSGIGCGPVFMRSIARELARDHRVVYWDYRGHGDSDYGSSSTGYRIQDHADDLDHVVRAFARDRQVVLISFSMGVQVSVEWTRSNPGRAAAHVHLLGVPRNPLHRTVVLRRPVARLAESIAKNARPLLGMIHRPARAILRTPISYALARSLGFIDRNCPEREFSDFVRFATDVPPDAYLRCCAGLLDHDGTESFRRIREPVLMLAADRDIFIDADECQRFSTLLPQARFELVRSGSHAGMIEYGALVSRRIRNFLDHVDRHVDQAA